MGAAPVALVVGFGAPARLPAAWAIDCAAGIEQEARHAGAHVVGGDVTAGDLVLVSVTGIGDLEGRSPVLRSGARPGDQVAVCGRLGWSAAGLALLAHGLTAPEVLIADHLQPCPPYSAGVQAALSGATAMIDISDGLVADARHIAQASGVRIDLSWHAIVEHLADGAQLLRDAASQIEEGRADDVVRHWVMHGGEDHGLLACFTGTPPAEFTVIGSVQAMAPEAGVWLDGEPTRGAGGHEHYRSQERPV